MMCEELDKNSKATRAKQNRSEPEGVLRKKRVGELQETRDLRERFTGDKIVQIRAIYCQHYPR